MTRALKSPRRKLLGGLDQFPQRGHHAALQFVQANQQDDHGGKQGRPLNHLLPGLLLLALALQQADEPVQLFNEGLGAGLKCRRIAADQRRMQVFVPGLLELLVAALQVGIGAVVQHGLEGLAGEALLQALCNAGEFFGVGPRGQFPAQVIGLHAHRACGVDRRRVALAEPGNQASAQRTGEGEHGNQDHRETCARGQGAAQPADHSRRPWVNTGKSAMQSSRGTTGDGFAAEPGALPLKSCRPIGVSNAVETKQQDADKQRVYRFLRTTSLEVGCASIGLWASGLR